MKKVNRAGGEVCNFMKAVYAAPGASGNAAAVLDETGFRLISEG